MSPSSLMSFAELFTPVEGRRSTIPEPSFHRNARLRAGSLESLDQDAGATIPADGDHVQDRRLALDRSVLQPQLGPAGFTRGAERNLGPGAGVVIVHPGLEHIHRVLLASRLRHREPLSRSGC